MIVEFAAVVAAVAFVVLVGYLVPTVIQVRKTVGESERLLARLNHELPLILKEFRGTSENVHAVTDHAREGIARTTVLFQALEEVGQTVHQVNGLVRGTGGTIFVHLNSVLAGMRAASAVLKRRASRASKEGGSYGRE